MYQLTALPTDNMNALTDIWDAAAGLCSEKKHPQRMSRLQNLVQNLVFLSPGWEKGLLNNSFQINLSSCLFRLLGKGDKPIKRG